MAKMIFFQVERPNGSFAPHSVLCVFYKGKAWELGMVGPRGVTVGRMELNKNFKFVSETGYMTLTHRGGVPKYRIEDVMKAIAGNPARLKKAKGSVTLPGNLYKYNGLNK